MSHTQFGIGFGTSAQIAGYAGNPLIPWEPIWNTTNSRIDIHLGTGAGAVVPMASETYVNNQIAGVTAGATNPQLTWLTCS